MNLDTDKHRQSSTSHQHHDLSTQQEIGPPPDAVSPLNDKSPANVSLTRATTIQTNSESSPEYPPALMGRDHEGDTVEKARQPRGGLPKPSSEAIDIPRPNGHTDIDCSPSSVLPTNGTTRANGSALSTSTYVVSNTTLSSRSSPRPVPSTSLSSGSPPPASPSPDDDAMVVDSHKPTNLSCTAVDSIEPLAKRTRSRQKRPPDSLIKEPAKRSRRSSNAAEATQLPSAGVNGSSKVTQDRGQEVKMRDFARVQTGPPASVNPGTGIGVDPSAPQASSSSSPTVPVQGSPSSMPISINTNLNSNLDPALITASNSTRPPADSSQSTSTSNKPSDQPITVSDKISTATSPGPGEQAKPPSSPNPPSSSPASNPYAGLSTALLKGTAGPGYNPYSLYYGPGTPITPHTPTYPYPYFYHLHSPVSAQAMYPTTPTFASSPTTQKSPSAPSPNSAEPQRQKPKRLKAHTVTSGNHNIPIVPRDKKGKPMLPLNVGIMTVIALGEVCTREHFHTERYIFPVGYEVTRRYLSTLDPTAEVVYHCTILDGGDGPKFQIVPSDAPDRTVIAGTATGAWSNIVKQANAIRNRQHSNSVSGPDFFGLGQNTIKHLIQELPHADHLRDYVWQNFIEGGPLGGRHAAVTPALPEDYDSTLPIGALYPAERDRLKREASLNNPQGLRHYPQHIIAQAEAQRRQHTSMQGSPEINQQPITPAHDQPHVSVVPLSLPPDAQVPVSNGLVGVSSHSSQQLGTVTPTTVPQNPSLSQSPPVPATNPSNLRQSPSAVPTTIASIMNAYPIPPQAAPSVSTSVSTPAPASS